MSTTKKKARVGLPLELELALPFLSATTDLPRFAAASKACRDVAGASYRKRIKENKFKIPGSDAILADTRNSQPSIMAPDSPEKPYYAEPWWLLKERQERYRRLGETYQVISIEIQDDGSWVPTRKFEWDDVPPPLPTKRKVTFPPKYMELFGDDTDIVHCSLVEKRMLVILRKWTDREDFHVPDTRQQLFAVMYSLDNDKKDQPQQLLLPTVCNELTEPLDRENYGCLEYVRFGNAQRSRDGKTVAVVTALPLGDEENDYGVFFRETAQIRVFDVTDIAVIKRCSLEIPIGPRTFDCYLTMAISNGGDLLSVNSVHDEVGENGDWRVYDIRGKGDAQVLAQKKKIAEHLVKHAFTPDNQLLVILPQREMQSEVGDMEPIDELKNESGFFVDGVDIPSWFAKRMVVLVGE